MEPRRLDGIRVLVVDDEPYLREIVAEILEQGGAPGGHDKSVLVPTGRRRRLSRRP